MVNQGLDVTAFISTDSAGAFPCEYVGYHGPWYHESDAHWSDPIWNVAAGHIHVGGLVPLEDGIPATETTLGELIGFLGIELWAPEPPSVV